MKRSIIFAIITLLLLTSCSSLSTRSIVSVAASGSPEAAARAMLNRKKLTYMRNPLQLASDLKSAQRDFERLTYAKTRQHLQKVVGFRKQFVSVN